MPLEVVPMTEDRDKPLEVEVRERSALERNADARQERVHRVIDEIRERQGWRRPSERKGRNGAG